LKSRLKKLKKVYKNQNLAILRRPQFIGNNLHRGRYLKPLDMDENRISLAPPPICVDATMDTLAAFSSPFGVITGMGVGPTLARTAERMTTTLLKAIKEKVEEEIAESKENP